MILFSLTFSLSGFSNENTNFWKETDKLLQELADAFSKKDKITGLRTLNITNDEVSKQKSQIMMNEIINEAKSKGITKVVFDRSGNLYHGRVAAFAQGARDGGLQF